jgi:hypothetical protein
LKKFKKEKAKLEEKMLKLELIIAFNDVTDANKVDWEQKYKKINKKNITLKEQICN